MAITQQLARIPEVYLAVCRQSASASPDGDPRWDPPASDVLDLDWAPALLSRLGEVSGLDEARLDALRQATDGDTALDLGFLNRHPHAIGPFGPVPAGLSSAQVARVSDLLNQIDIHALLAALPLDEREAGCVIGHGADRIIGGPREYLVKHFNALRDFYLDAAKRHLLIVLWWH
ncbi:DUF1877 domain-containing protein [Streptomyces sp. NPDC089424]|uniref:DUF1877 domain-containing protein n=1 Tax=Streptomyces sp. NPDC089424 TaxID=3365917 RepID=UPI00382E252A